MHKQPRRQICQIRMLPDGKKLNLFTENGKLFFDSTIPFEFFGGAIHSITQSNGNLAIKYFQLDHPSDKLASNLTTIYVDEIFFF